ncbi:MAG: conserved integral membrane alanine AND leucine RICH protein [Firmicutes bacterium GWF2_51_9]|nr:MAG: conserved integral membrane alanine AND leucine RICH protein [Firmicutes bacterium GWF2_51_9]OGS59167.1 MAG: conserved integral membrane alanine AND leucine RICH protein [Firmicutes bacterium GWE2_51_13]HAM62156.1 hypothetical protein [Erysipelotrichaceae bacterium]HBZ41729.1 hypothetical protein [Erysipelotrichaceae bacterium]
MASKGKEIVEELKSVFLGKTLDAILPPLVFAVVNGVFGLPYAILGSILLSLTFGILRISRKQNWIYAFGGLVTISLAASFAYLANNAANYFIPGIVSNAFILALALFSLAIDRPMAAYASHLTRGWRLDWFWRKDVKPAYREVTWLWTLFFLMRTFLQVTLFLSDNVDSLVWVNTLMGLPVTTLILVSSYVYGIWRLRTLKGPGIDEFIAGKTPPYKGQTRGF